MRSAAQSTRLRTRSIPSVSPFRWLNDESLLSIEPVTASGFFDCRAELDFCSEFSLRRLVHHLQRRGGSSRSVVPAARGPTVHPPPSASIRPTVASSFARVERDHQALGVERRALGPSRRRDTMTRRRDKASSTDRRPFAPRPPRVEVWPDSCASQRKAERLSSTSLMASRTVARYSSAAAVNSSLCDLEFGLPQPRVEQTGSRQTARTSRTLCPR